MRYDYRVRPQYLSFIPVTASFSEKVYKGKQSQYSNFMSRELPTLSVSSTTIIDEGLERYTIVSRSEGFYSLREQILSFTKLPFDWNSYGAEAIPMIIVKRAIEVLEQLDDEECLPEYVFPTGRDSIQFDYTQTGQRDCEIEIIENEIHCLSSLNGNVVGETITNNIPRVVQFVKQWLHG